MVPMYELVRKSACQRDSPRVGASTVVHAVGGASIELVWRSRCSAPPPWATIDGHAMRDPHAQRTTLGALHPLIGEQLGAEVAAILTSACVLLARSPVAPSCYETCRAVARRPARWRRVTPRVSLELIRLDSSNRGSNETTAGETKAF